MNAQTQKRNSTAAVIIVVLVLLLVVGIGLYFAFGRPAATTVAVTPAAPVAAPAPAPAPAAPPVAAGPKMMGKHTVIPRDTLWWISDKWYQDPVLWPSIYEINKSEINNPDLIYPGQKFDIPALTGTSKDLSAEDKSLLAQGYLEAYRVYKQKGKKDAADYQQVGNRLSGKK